MMTACERVILYSDLIEIEKKRIKESQERIAEWAYHLQKAANEVANG